MHDYDKSSATAQGAFVISRSWSGDYLWKLEDAQGRVLDSSINRYDSYESCLQAIERIKRVAATAIIAGLPVSSSD